MIEYELPSKECAAFEGACAAICRTLCARASHDMHAQVPTDPNEKLIIAKRFVRPEQWLVYPIHFENIGTIEARDVSVIDELDPALDEATLMILTPNGASYDLSTRTLRWELLGVNVPPSGSGNLLFAIKVRVDTPSGTVIRNRASIRFEIFEPLDTNEVETTIDARPPACTMSELPAISVSESIALSWSGTDAVGEVESYSVLVSRDGGPYVPLVERTPATATSFAGESGHSYGFICIAVDTAGNVEVQGAVAETTTFIETDKGAPQITVAASPSALWPPNGKTASVIISGRITDAGVGVEVNSVSYAVIDEYGSIQPSGAVAVDASGGYSFTIRLEASREGRDKDGRRYTIAIQATDKVGNKGAAEAVVTVPHDRR